MKTYLAVLLVTLFLLSLACRFFRLDRNATAGLFALMAVILAIAHFL